MRRTTFVLAFALLAGCSPTAPDDRAIEVISETGGTPVESVSATEKTDEISTEPIVDTSAQCDEDTYRPLVGQAAGGRQFPVGPRLRVFAEGDIITQELVPQRTNIVVDNSGMITRVYCG